LRDRTPLDIIPGMVAGAVLGLVVLLFLMTPYLVFPGDLVILGTVVGGMLGYLLGNDFFIWFREKLFWWWWT
jgi:hypothetical protein